MSDTLVGMKLGKKELDAVKAYIDWKRQRDELGTAEDFCRDQGYSRVYLDRMVAYVADYGVPLTSAPQRKTDIDDPFYAD